jgi:hypothetical protein
MALNHFESCMGRHGEAARAEVSQPKQAKASELTFHFVSRWPGAVALR